MIFFSLSPSFFLRSFPSIFFFCCFCPFCLRMFSFFLPFLCPFSVLLSFLTFFFLSHFLSSFAPFLSLPPFLSHLALVTRTELPSKSHWRAIKNDSSPGRCHLAPTGRPEAQATQSKNRYPFIFLYDINI